MKKVIGIPRNYGQATRPGKIARKKGNIPENMGYYIEHDISESWKKDERARLMGKMSTMRPGPVKEKVKQQLQDLKHAKKTMREFVRMSGGAF